METYKSFYFILYIIYIIFISKIVIKILEFLYYDLNYLIFEFDLPFSSKANIATKQTVV